MQTTINCIQELAIVSTTKEYTSVEPEDRVTETNSKPVVRAMIHILPSLTHIFVQELPENELVAIVSATKECTSVEDRDMGTNSKAAVSGLTFILSSL